MNILLATSEAVPFAKTGGLADVCGALPSALASLGEKPALIILCLDMNEREGFQVLSMLKLDQDTRAIPLLTCLSEYELPAESTTFFDREDDDEISQPVPAASMN